MKNIRLGAGVLNQTPLDWKGNLRRIIAAIREARAQHVDLLCLPELCITGYGCEDVFHSSFVSETALTILQEIASETEGMTVSVGLPFFYHNALFNTAALIVDRTVVGLVPKQNLAGDGLHYEPRWFKPWSAGVKVDLPLFGRTVPFGDLLFDVGGVRVGFEICEDAWVASRPGARLAQYGADIILNPSASHFAFGKAKVRERFVVEGSRAFSVSYVYSNLMGNEAGRIIYDGGAMIATNGQLVGRGPRLSFAEYGVTHAVVDVELTRSAQRRAASFRPEASEHKGLVQAAFPWPSHLPSAPSGVHSVAAWEQSAHLKEEELARAVSLALFDYLHKSRARGFVVSLSGGADSSAVACLVHIMVKRALEELGTEGIARRLAYIPDLPAALASSRTLSHRLLTTIYQPSANSGEITRRAARTLAEAIGARHLEIDIASVVDTYTQKVEQALDRKLAWESDDLALQNIQARVRGPSAWLIANLQGALLLATSNRSESALGYATMDGDTCGGLSPIAGIDKAFLRGWLRWLERVGPHEIGPISALSSVNVQASTPELRPSTAAQTTERDLMPFWLLDRIERHAVRDRRSPKETLLALTGEGTGLSLEELEDAVRRFFRLFAQNQWKRERYAPSFHLDDENLDPKTWFRFPILSGRFEQELSELAKGDGV